MEAKDIRNATLEAIIGGIVMKIIIICILKI